MERLIVGIAHRGAQWCVVPRGPVPFIGLVGITARVASILHYRFWWPSRDEGGGEGGWLAPSLPTRGTCTQHGVRQDMRLSAFPGPFLVARDGAPRVAQWKTASVGAMHIHGDGTSQSNPTAVCMHYAKRFGRRGRLVQHARALFWSCDPNGLALAYLANHMASGRRVSFGEQDPFRCNVPYITGKRRGWERQGLGVKHAENDNLYLHRKRKANKKGNGEGQMFWSA